VPDAAALRHRDVSLPFGLRHTQLPLLQIDIPPFERHDLAAVFGALRSVIEQGPRSIRFHSTAVFSITLSAGLAGPAALRDGECTAAVSIDIFGLTSS
jgi:hypothetical protein